MFYILEDGIRLKKWGSGWACCITAETKNPFPLRPDDYKCLFFEKGYYREISEAMKGWKNLLPLTEEEERLLSGEA